MINAETIIVGSGPAGAAAAWELKRQGRECLLLDRESFPREKLCAGWITPEVLADLEFAPEDYPHRFLTFDELHVCVKGLPVSMATRQHSVRRYEFDQWLVARSGVPLYEHTVRSVVGDAEGYTIDGAFQCRYIIGAGGTRCPVYRELFRPGAPRSKPLQTVTMELEYPCQWSDPRCHLWFFDKGLRGYSWYVPKADGYLNIGVGGMAERLARNDDHIRRHWQNLLERLLRAGLLSQVPSQTPHGYSYYLWSEGASNVGQANNAGAYLVGDALGLASRDMCEGIGPAVRSGLQAARAIAGDHPYRPDIRPHTLSSRWLGSTLARFLA
ncbi:MAG: FAD-dependent monooxygenase [Proteobacteria bacterium]|nr:FAD-dependent monooxygenase [Pseudomonadota bacterium]